MDERVLHQWLPHLNHAIRGAIRKCTECSTNAGLFDYLRSRDEGVRTQTGWCCCGACFERAAEREFKRLASYRIDIERPRWHRLPLGLILLSRGVVDREQLRSALDAQRSAGQGRIGDWLRKLGYASEYEVTKALSVQWGCPFLRGSEGRLMAGEWVPFSLATSYGMVPVQYIPATRNLYVAFSQGIDRSALYGVEQMMDCHTEPCVVEESVLKRCLESPPRNANDEIVFETDQSPIDMARICSSYALQVHAEEARFVRCGEFIWARLKCRSGELNLLFRLRARDCPAKELPTS